MRVKLLIIVIMAATVSPQIMAETLPFDIQGELSGWNYFVGDGFDSTETQLGLRYIPNVSAELFTIGEGTVDIELSGNLYYSKWIAGKQGETYDLKPYRLWIRYTDDRFEARLGLQKINFGPAKVLRTLMWFDRLDPRDPLQLTEGVYGIRMRYDFPNNANIWGWGLFGNRDPKGWEFIGTEKGTPEYGGRVQYPLGNGEVAFTTHYRVLSPTVARSGDVVVGKNTREHRVALDGIWDLGVEVWFESALVNSPFVNSPVDWQSFLTLGMDYTFPVGNGLLVLGEHLSGGMGSAPFNRDEKVDLTGFLISYPLGLTDQIAFFQFYNWYLKAPYYYMSWQRTYDFWRFYVGGYWSPRTNTVSINESLATPGRSGLQIIIIFNH
ncbi:MAG: hypothetical protein GXO92_02640 [FCB group bacterium]|nr:hypothetical protein [FCB group bacterium]